MIQAKLFVLGRRESELIRAVITTLHRLGIFSIRMNSGVARSDGRYVRFGSPGIADILAFIPKAVLSPDEQLQRVIWIECKSAKGRQSSKQKLFQHIAFEKGQKYVLAHSIEDVLAVLREDGLVV